MDKAICLMCGKEGHFSCSMNTKRISENQNEKIVPLFDEENRKIKEKSFVKNEHLY